MLRVFGRRDNRFTKRFEVLDDWILVEDRDRRIVECLTCSVSQSVWLVRVEEVIHRDQSIVTHPGYLCETE